MRTVEIKTHSGISKVMIGESLKNLAQYTDGRKCIIITDDNILRYYQDALPPWHIISIGTGEKHKTLATLEGIFEKLLEFEADRSSFIVGIGGGIVCDVAGFAASVYMRGLRFGFVSTTLLSQVDASVGGKNGVNFRKYKNMLGVFNQPEFVICDPVMLNTLDENEFRAGFAEIVKAGAIKSPGLFSYIESCVDKALMKEPQVIEQLVYDAVRIKADVVEADEREAGERRKLNFGHTFAHAFENLNEILHGEAVSMGMVVASQVSCKLGYLAQADADRIKNLLVRLKLPVEPVISPALVLSPMRKDKKREGDMLHMVLLRAIGEAMVKKINFKELEGILYDMY